MNWGLKEKVIAVVGFIVGLAALVTAVQTIATHSKPWICSAGAPIPWCRPPNPPENWSSEWGGTKGGEAFTPITCRSAETMVGLYGRAIDRTIGPFVFSIGPICAAARFSWRHKLISLPAETLRKADFVGRDAGEPFELKCPANTVVIGSELQSAVMATNFGSFNYLIVPLVLRCSSVLSSADPSLIATVSGAGEPPSHASRQPFFCLDGSAAYGIKGRSGQFIDALSVGCRAPQN